MGQIFCKSRHPLYDEEQTLKISFMDRLFLANAYFLFIINRVNEKDLNEPIFITAPLILYLLSMLRMPGKQTANRRPDALY